MADLPELYRLSSLGSLSSQKFSRSLHSPGLCLVPLSPNSFLLFRTSLSQEPSPALTPFRKLPERLCHLILLLPGSLLHHQHLHHGDLITELTNTPDRTLLWRRVRGGPDKHQVSNMCSYHSKTPPFHMAAESPLDSPLQDAPKCSGL